MGTQPWDNVSWPRGDAARVAAEAAQATMVGRCRLTL